MNKKLPIILTTITSFMLTLTGLAFSTYKQTKADDPYNKTITTNYLTESQINNTPDRWHIGVWFSQMKTNTHYNDLYIDVIYNNYSSVQPTRTEEELDKNQTFFILQITPYLSLTNTNLNIDINIATWGYLETQPTINQTMTITQYEYEFNQTKENLSQYINTQNWTQEEYAKNTYNEIEESIEEKTQLKAQARTWVEEHELTKETISLTNISVNDTTTYIYGIIKTNCEDPTKHTIIDKINITGQTQILGTIEVIDIGGLMFQILAMPFAFISQAFNITLFRGTNYAVNISQLFLGIIAVAIFLWIIKLILGKADFGQFLNDAKHNKKDNKKDKDV